MNKLKILLVEDVEEEAGLIKRVLNKDQLNFTLIRVDTPAEFTHALDTFLPHVVLADHALPQFNSIEALQLCQGRGLMIPFILVTGTVSEEFAVSCLKRGVDDYILKSNLSRLPTAIRNALRQREAESKRLAAEFLLKEQNVELRNANEELRKANMELDNFVYSVSHTLRSPLTSVMGLIRIARDELGRESLNEILDMMDRSINNLDDTIKEILDYSLNSRANKVIEVIDMNALMEVCKDQLKKYPLFDHLEIKLVLSPGVNVRSDRSRMIVIMENLISNSIKYQDTYKEKRFLHVHISEVEKGLLFQFIDNGLGIAAEQLPLVFNMFYRASNFGDGAGLGLYIVREVVHKLAGTISIDSQQGQGTTVTILLPSF